MLLHPDDKQTFETAKKVANFLARSEGLWVLVFEPKRRPLDGSAFGLCYTKEARISIAFRWMQRAGDGGNWYPKPLSQKTVMTTVAHEVAHLKHPNHGKQFRELEKKLIGKLDLAIDNANKVC